MKRAKLRGLKRNAAVMLGNLDDVPSFIAALSATGLWSSPTPASSTSYEPCGAYSCARHRAPSLSPDRMRDTRPVRGGNYGVGTVIIVF